MDKKYVKQYKIHGHKNCKIGTPLGIHDKNGIEIHSGDKILWNGRECIVLWGIDTSKYMAYLTYSKWYGDDIFNSDSYGKGFSISMDNGAKMEIEIIESLKRGSV